MRRTTLIAALVMMVAGAAYAATKDNKVSVTGYIIDNACSAKFHDADGVKGHPKSCALMDGCVKSGYAVFSDGKYYKLDKTGNA
ncbi:MAG TPA: hypothetical protein VLZ81_06625, partial [Blastocatellia bacterium]|nr:hypothetical protein [Blastocatellia bacterium]